MKPKSFYEKLKDYVGKSGSLKRSKICKATKDEHTFVKVILYYEKLNKKYEGLSIEEYYTAISKEDRTRDLFSGKTIIYYECSGCGKKKYEFKIYDS